MSNLAEYLDQKADALVALEQRAASPAYAPSRLAATVTAEGRSGVRRIRIREFQILSDSPADFAGYDLGPSSPEIQLGVLGSCLTHSFLIQAARYGVQLDAVSVEVTGKVDARAGKPGHEDTPVFPHDIAYRIDIDSPASEGSIIMLAAAVERSCPILNLLRQPQSLRRDLRHNKIAARNAAE
jgi:uncharacterized OsmC-like protein